MSTNSKIEWTDKTWSPVVGCTRVSAGCDHCYAATMTHRLASMRRKEYMGLTVLNGKGDRHFNGVVRCLPERLTDPLSWKKPRRVFVNSMSDLFHKDVPFEFIDKVFAVMALCPQHTFQVLTKRPERMVEYTQALTFERLRACANLAADGGPHRAGNYNLTSIAHRTRDKDAVVGRMPSPPLPNVWLGTSVEDQRSADERIPHLLKCPASVRFLSCEPLLGPIDLSLLAFMDGGTSSLIDWLIVGGESGPGARPCNVEWIFSIAAQCKAAGVPVFVKQVGAKPFEEIHMDPEFAAANKFISPATEWWKLESSKGGDPAEWPEELRVREYPREAAV